MPQSTNKQTENICPVHIGQSTCVQNAERPTAKNKTRAIRAEDMKRSEKRSYRFQRGTQDSVQHRFSSGSTH